jgi:hypothetical protein
VRRNPLADRLSETQYNALREKLDYLRDQHFALMARIVNEPQTSKKKAGMLQRSRTLDAQIRTLNQTLLAHVRSLPLIEDEYKWRAKR